MKIDVLTLFPGMFTGPLHESIIKKARENGLVEIDIHNIRDWTSDKHRTADDKPFGGGPGMVMKPEPIFQAIDYLVSKGKADRVILLSPQGKRLTQALAVELAGESHLILICGHYEGVDERVRSLVTDEISIGDYILTGGELPAMILIDAITRLVPGVVGDSNSINEETFSDGLLEYPQYTRPAVYRGLKVPEVLLSGNHKRIQQWRKAQALKKTCCLRPDLMARSKIE